jgi:hypothetical protein
MKDSHGSRRGDDSRTKRQRTTPLYSPQGEKERQRGKEVSQYDLAAYLRDKSK